MQLKTRPGKALPADRGSIFLLGWKEFWNNCVAMLHCDQALLFMIVHFFSSDALMTLLGNAFLIMEENESAVSGKWTTLMSLHVNFALGALAAFVGIFIYAEGKRRFMICSKAMLNFQFTLMMAVAVVCLGGGLRWIGFAPVMAPVAVTIGAMQSLSRSVFSNLIPPGQEASMFAFYEIILRGSNIIGAMVTLLIHNLAHSYIPTMWYILLCFAAATSALSFVDIEQGMKDVDNMRVGTGKDVNEISGSPGTARQIVQA